MKKTRLLFLLFFVLTFYQIALSQKYGIIKPTNPGQESDVVPIDKTTYDKLIKNQLSSRELKKIESNHTGNLDTLYHFKDGTVNWGIAVGDTHLSYYDPPKNYYIKSIGVIGQKWNTATLTSQFNIAIHKSAHPWVYDPAKWDGDGCFTKDSLGYSTLIGQQMWGPMPATIIDGERIWLQMIFLGNEPDTQGEPFIISIVPLGDSASYMMGTPAVSYNEQYDTPRLAKFYQAGRAGHSPQFVIRNYSTDIFCVAESYSSSDRPEINEITPVSSYEISITWTDIAPDNLGYKVKRYDTLENLEDDIPNDEKDESGEYACSCLYDGLDPGTLYYFKVVPYYSGCVEGDASESCTARTFFEVSGNVLYENDDESPIKNAKVHINDFEDNSDITGAYNLFNIPPGTYSVMASKDEDWVWVTAGDAQIIAQHAAHIPPGIPIGLKRNAADVNGDRNIFASDAQLVLQKAAHMPVSFAIPDWLFLFPTVTLDFYNLSNINIKGICAGDVNGSYKHSLMLQNNFSQNMIQGTISFNAKKGNIVETNISQNYKLQVQTVKDLKIGAFTLIVKYPNESLNFEGVENSFFNKNFILNQINDMVILAWFDSTGGFNPLEYKEDEIIMALNFKIIKNTNKLSSYLEPEIEITDPSGNIIAYNKLKLPTSDMNDLPTKFELYQNFPNPFNSLTQINYDLISVSHVELYIYNILGEKVYELINKAQEPGYYHFNWDSSDLATGIYIYEIKIQSDSELYVKRKKMMLIR